MKICGRFQSNRLEAKCRLKSMDRVAETEKSLIVTQRDQVTFLLLMETIVPYDHLLF